MPFQYGKWVRPDDYVFKSHLYLQDPADDRMVHSLCNSKKSLFKRDYREVTTDVSTVTCKHCLSLLNNRKVAALSFLVAVLIYLQTLPKERIIK